MNHCVAEADCAVPGRGLEPLRISPPDPKSGASANSATPASLILSYAVQSKAMKRRSSSDQTLPPRATVHAQKPQPLLENHFAKFMPVRDSRNRRVRGLYQRNGRYYAQLWVDCGYGKKSPRRFPLLTPENLPACTLQEAKEASFSTLRCSLRNSFSNIA